jgi:hypothetical protein
MYILLNSTICKIGYFIYKIYNNQPFHYYDMAWLFIDYFSINVTVNQNNQQNENNNEHVD